LSLGFDGDSHFFPDTAAAVDAIRPGPWFRRNGVRWTRNSLSRTMDSARIPCRPDVLPRCFGISGIIRRNGVPARFTVLRECVLGEACPAPGVTAAVDFAELARDASRPATGTGPRDLAPLAREAIRGLDSFSLRFPFLRHCRHEHGRFPWVWKVSG
jgi:hypothetical protein